MGTLRSQEKINRGHPAHLGCLGSRHTPRLEQFEGGEKLFLRIRWPDKTRQFLRRFPSPIDRERRDRLWLPGFSCHLALLEPRVPKQGTMNLITNLKALVQQNFAAAPHQPRELVPPDS